ncbi:MAG: hypothetical protein WC846_02145 [Candidatus Gracilibacteria bacterium]|jgi:hypothetical protein
MSKKLPKRLFILAFAALFLLSCGTRDTTYDYLAKCMTRSGVKFYGSYNCHNCTNQKKMFGDSAEYLPYIECNPNAKDNEASLCDEAGVTSIPDWRFPDGTKKIGTQKLEDLSTWSSCPIDGEESVMYEGK